MKRFFGNFFVFVVGCLAFGLIAVVFYAITKNRVVVTAAAVVVWSVWTLLLHYLARKSEARAGRKSFSR